MLVLSNIRQKMEQTNEKENKRTASVKKPASKAAGSVKKTTTSKTTTKKAASSKTATATKKATTSKTTTATKKAASSKSTTATKKATTSKSATTKKATTSKSATTKKAASSKVATVVKKSSSKKIAKTDTKVLPIKNIVDEKVELQNILNINENAKPVEYYDLPYRYNQTLIKILAQTPHSLFLYWDISDDDRQNMIKAYGDNFFYETKPVLLVHNKTQNYSFEVEVDDFTNSWYLRTPTSNCTFEVELGRKKINSNNADINFGAKDNLLHISVSNVIESPNDHILNDFPRKVFFKNIKTNELEERKVNSLSNMKNMYKDFELDSTFIHNPSSSFKI